MTNRKLVFDIETVGHDFGSFDPTTQAVLTNWIEKQAEGDTAKYKILLENLKNELGFSPLTGEIVALGVLDCETRHGAVYFQTAGHPMEPVEESGIKYQPMDEPAMLQKFWEIARECAEFISFNGRAFDAPWLLARSAKHKIKPTRDLMEGRYLYQQKNCRHLDLQDQLSYYGATRRPGSLHLWCRLFNIDSPKAEGVDGSQVTAMYKDGKYFEIARYNAADLRATKELYDYWNTYLRF